MELQGERRIAADRLRVFKALCDENVLVRCIGPLEAMERRAENDYAARLAFRIGPFGARFAARVKVEPLSPPGLYRLCGFGKGPFGSAQAEVDIRLEEDDGATNLIYRLSARLGGHVAALGNRIADDKAKRHIGRFFERLEAAIGA